MDGADDVAQVSATLLTAMAVTVVLLPLRTKGMYVFSVIAISLVAAVLGAAIVSMALPAHVVQDAEHAFGFNLPLLFLCVALTITVLTATTVFLVHLFHVRMVQLDNDAEVRRLEALTEAAEAAGRSRPSSPWQRFARCLCASRGA